MTSALQTLFLHRESNLVLIGLAQKHTIFIMDHIHNFIGKKRYLHHGDTQGGKTHQYVQATLNTHGMDTVLLTLSYKGS